VSLCRWAKATWIEGKVTGVDRKNKLVLVEGLDDVPYDVLSINIGSRTLGTYSTPGVQDYALTTRPISELIPKLTHWDSMHQNLSAPRVVVVGGGAAGVELAWGLKARYLKFKPQMTLISSQPGLVSKMGESTEETVTQLIKEHNIKLYSNYRCVEVRSDQVVLSDGTTIDFDLCCWATGPEAHDVCQNMDLELDACGFIAVSQTLQTLSDPMIFASGDCASVQGCTWVQKAGVFAVREGPVISENIMSLLHNAKLTVYEPQVGFLSLMMTGDGNAVGSWKGMSMHGWSMWWTKDKIDRGFMDKFDVSKMGQSPAKYI